MAMPKGFSNTAKSGSRVMIVQAPAASAASMNLSSLGSRQTFCFSDSGVTHKADVRRVSSHAWVSVLKFCSCFTRSSTNSYSAKISSLITGSSMPYSQAFRHKCGS
jgi:hypothetical protein